MNHAQFPAPGRRLAAIATAVTLAAVFGLHSNALAQSTYWWLGQDEVNGYGGYWSYNNNFSSSEQGSPLGSSLPSFQGYINFGQISGGSTTVGLINTNDNYNAGFQVYFKSDAPGAYNLYGNPLTFYDYSSMDPNIQNEGTTFTHVINLALTNGNINGTYNVLNINGNSSPAQGPITFNGSIYGGAGDALSRVINVGGGAVTFNGPLVNGAGGGTLGLTVLGGTTTLSAPNLYTGLTTINGGTLTVSGSGSLGGGAYAPNIADNGAFNYNSSAVQVLGGVIGGTGSLTLGGAGILLLATNNYSGGTTIGGSGTILITNDLALGTAGGGITFTASGTIAATNNGATVNNPVVISSARTITVNGGVSAGFYTPDTNNLNVAAYITGAGGVTKKSSSYLLGTVRFSNDTNSYTGDFFAGFGITEFTSVFNQGTPSSLGEGATASGGLITLGNLSSNGTLRYVGTNNCATMRPLVWTETIGSGYILDVTNIGTISYLNPTNLVAGLGVKTLTLTGSNTGTNTLAEAIGNDATNGLISVAKTGAGTWLLTGSNSYSGGTTLSGGVLSIVSSNGLGTGPFTITENLAGATASFLNVATAASVILTNNIVLPYATTANSIYVLTKNKAGQLTLGGTISGGGSGLILRATSDTAGDQVTVTEFAGTNTFAGGLQVYRGVAQVDNPASLGVGTIYLDGNTSPLGDLSFANSMTFTNPLTLQTASTISNASSVTLTGVISGNYALTKYGAGTLTFGGGNINTYGGPTTIAAGTLQLGQSGAFGNLGSSSTSVVVNSGATLAFYQAETLPQVISGSGVLQVLNAVGAITETLTAANTFSGNININSASILKITGSGYLGGGNYSGNITNAGTFNYNSSAVQTLTGVMSGAGALSQNGVGMLTLSGANSYTGPTTDTTTLLVDGSLASGSAVTVVAGATLGGTGAINGPVNVLAGAELSPGDPTISSGIGTLTLANNSAASLTLNGNNLIKCNLSTTAGTSDLIAISGASGALVLNGASYISLATPLGTAPAGAYTLMTYAAQTGSGTLALDHAYPNATLTVGPTSVTLTVTGSGITALKWLGDGVANAWNTTAPGDWLNGATTVTYTDGSAVTIDDTSTNKSINITPSAVAPASVMVNNSVNNYTIGGSAIGGTGGLTKFGTGALTLTNVNTYSGPTILNAGSLTVGGAGSLGGGNYAGGITNNGTLVFASSANQTDSGAISGTGTITFGGSGTVTLSGNNSYTGATTVSNGTVNVTGNESAATGGWLMPINSANVTVNFQSGSVVSVAGNAAVQVGSSPSSGTPNTQTMNVAGIVTNNGTLLIGRGGYLNLNSGASWLQTNVMSVNPPAGSGYSAYLSLLSGSGFTYTGPNPIVLAGSSGNSGDGLMTIGGGTFTTGQGFTNIPSLSTGYGLLTMTNGGILALTANVPELFTGTNLPTTGSLVLGAGGGVINNGGYSTTISNIINGAGGLTLLGSGSLTLSNLNTYTGATLVGGGGTLALGGNPGDSGSGIIGSSAITVSNGATLLLNGMDVLGYSSSSALTVFGIVEKIYNQNETLNRPITLSGGMITNTLAAGTSAYEMLGNYIATAAGTSNSITGPGQFGLRTTSTYFTNAPGSVLNFSAQIVPYSSGIPLSKLGAGTMILYSNNTYSGNTVVSGGTLGLTGAAGIGSSPAILMAPGALLDVSGLTSTFALGASQTLVAGRQGTPATDVNGNFSSGGTINIAGTGTNGTLTISGNLALTGGTLNYDLGSGVCDLITLNGASRTLTLSGTTTVAVGLVPPGAYTLINGIAGGTSGSGSFTASFTGTGARGTLSAVFSTTTPTVTMTVSDTTAPAALVWKGANNGTWDINTTANWLNTSGAASTFYNLDVVTFGDGPTTSTVSNLANVYPGLVTFTNNTTTYTFTNTGGVGGIAGGASVIKNSGAGIVYLNSANTYSGGTTVGAGTLGVGNGVVGTESTNALGTGLVTVNTGGTLLFQPGGSSVNWQIPNPISLNGGIIEGKDGFQHLTGPVAVGASGGTLNQYWDTKSVYVDGVLSGSGPLTVNSGGGGAYTGVHFSNPLNTYSGTITVTGNGVTVDNTYALSNAIVNITSGGSSGALEWGSGVTSIILGGFSGSFNLANGGNALSVGNNGSTSTYSGVLSGAGALTKLGAGTFIMSGVNTYSGATTVAAGTLAVAGRLTGGGAVTVSDGAALSVTANGATSVITNAVSLTLGASGAATLSFSNFAGNATAPIYVTNLTANGVTTVALSGIVSAGEYPLIKFLSGVISGTGSFTAQQAGLPPGGFAAIVTNVPNSSIDVVLTINPVVWVGATNGVNVANWDNGVTTNWSLLGQPNYFTNGESVQIDDTAIGTNTLNLTATLSPFGVLVTNNARNYTISATGASVLTGGMVLSKRGPGMLTITESNSFTGGATISGGAVNLQNGYGLNGSTVTVNSGAELQLQGGINVAPATPLILAGAGTNNTGGLHNLAGNNTYGGTITLAGVTRINSDSSTLTLTNGMTAGANPVTLGGNGNITISTKTVSGSGGVVKDGAGTNIWSIDPSLSSGGVTVSNGTFQINVGNFGTTFAPLITVEPGATLWGNTTHATGGGAAVVVNGGTWLLSDEDYKQYLTMVDGLITPSPNPDSSPELRVGFAGGSGSWTWFVSNSIAGSVINSKINTVGAGVNLTWNVTRGSANSDLTLNGQIYNSGNLAFTGNGVTTLAATNTWIGSNVVSAGTLNISGQLAGGDTNIVNDGAILNLVVAAGRSTITNASSLTLGTSVGATLGIQNFAGSATAPVYVTNLAANGTVTVVVTNSNPLNLVVGQWPLIKYTGSIGGAGFGAFNLAPFPRGVVAVLVNNTANNSVDLNVLANDQITWNGNVVGGIWDTNNTANWTWNGSATTYQQNSVPGDGVLFNDNAAGTTAVTLNEVVSPLVVVFNNTNKAYTLGGTGAITGTNSLVANGPGSVTITNANSFSGTTYVNGGVLTVLNRLGDAPYSIGQYGQLKLGYSTGGGYATTAMTIAGNGSASTNGFYLAGGKTYNVSGGAVVNGAPTTIRQYGSGLASLGIFDINSNPGLSISTAASGSATDPNIQLISDGYGMVVTTAAGANNATGDLVVNGPLNVGGQGLYTRGSGSVLLNGVATAGNVAVQLQGGMVICGITNCLGVNAAVPISSGATLALDGYNQIITNLTGSGAVVGGSATTSVLTMVNTTPDTNACVLGGTNVNQNNLALAMSGTGTLWLAAANTYTGNTTISAGTLALASTGSISNSANLNLAAGATFDVSAINAFALSVTNDLNAAGAASAATLIGASGGTVNLGSQPITLTYDGSHPALTISQGTLVLNANAFTVNSASPLSVGTYTIVSASSAITGTGTYSVAGTAMGAGTVGAVTVSGSSVVLTVQNVTTTTLSLATGTNPSTYGTTLTFQAAVSPAPADGETITFMDGIATIGVGMTASGVATLTTSALAAGGHSITASYPGDASDVASTSSALGQGVNSTPLTITANDANKVYDGLAYTGGNGVTYAGFVNGETNTVLSGALTYGGAAQGTIVVGTYAITPAGLSNLAGTNYAITFVDGTLTIQQASTFVGASSSENPSGFQDSVSFQATLPGDATGSVVFSSTNGPISTNSVSAGVAASLAITTLPRGTNVITVVYSGDANYLGSTATLNQIVTNHPPVASLMTVTRTAGFQLVISLSSLATNWSDVDGDTVELTGVNMQSTNGVNLLALNWSTNLDGSIVTTNARAHIGYTDGPNVNDQISYAISDGQGGTNIGYINIVIQSNVTGTNLIAGITTGGTNVVNAFGIPGYSYILERATNLAPAVWIDVSTNAAATNGVINAADTFWDLGGTSPSSAYYRLKWQP